MCISVHSASEIEPRPIPHCRCLMSESFIQARATQKFTAIVVAVRDSQRPDAARLDEFELRGDAVTKATTYPTFGVSLRGIDGC